MHQSQIFNSFISIPGKDILFSGDIGSSTNPFLKNNSLLDRNVHYLFVEGKYRINNSSKNNQGDRIKFQQIIGEKLEERFRIIIPAFVLDRTQQVLYEIEQGMKNKYISPNTVVKAFSPTSEKITELYKNYSLQSNKYDEFFSDKIFTNLFKIKNLIYNPKNSDGSYNTEIDYGEIAVMSSGMASSIFSKDAVNLYVEDPRTFILLVGYQADDTISRDLIEASENDKDSIIIDGVKKKIKSENIFRSYVFNSHADINQILDIFNKLSPEKIFLIHLNKEAIENVKKSYQENFPDSKIIVPVYGEKYDLK